MKPAYYDSINDEIIGAVEGSLIWWHEKGHQWLQHKIAFYRFWSFQNQLALIVASLLFSILNKRIEALCVILAWLCLQFSHEAFAWLYAFAYKYSIKNISRQPLKKASCKK